MNNWLNKLERKYGRFGIPNLTNILVAGQILVFAIELFIDRTITAWVGLNRFFLLQGQIWRAITFVFIPFSGGSILSVVLGIYFTWFVGTALEKEWGDFRYTLYFLLGMVGGMVIGLFHGILSVRYKVNQVISGIGLNLLALAVTTLLMQLIWNNKGSTPQVASISTPDARTLVIQPWDGTLLKAVEKALLASELGINPQNDGKVIRLIFPQLTEERRKELTKQVKKYGEGGKVAIRNIRRDAMEKFKAMKKKSELTEDDLKELEEAMQKLTDKRCKEIDDLTAKKEAELMAV